MRSQQTIRKFQTKTLCVEKSIASGLKKRSRDIAIREKTDWDEESFHILREFSSRKKNKFIASWKSLKLEAPKTAAILRCHCSLYEVWMLNEMNE